MNRSVAMSKGDAMAVPGLTHLFTMRAALGARLDGGNGPLGRRVFNAASGGEFAGPRLRGAVVPGSADWMLIRRDGSMVIDARVILQTDDGATIHMTYAGRAIFPADRGSASAWHGRWRCAPPCWCWTSPSPRSTSRSRRKSST